MKLIQRLAYGYKNFEVCACKRESKLSIEGPCPMRRLSLKSTDFGVDPKKDALKQTPMVDQ